MMHTLRRLVLLSLVAFAPAGAFASASTVSEVLGVEGNRPVTRAEFLKAGVIVLGVSVDMEAPANAYRSYDEALRPYVRAADERKAFDAFGANPDMSKAVTRGEAIRLLYELREWVGTGAVLPFRDVQASSELGAAIKLAAQHKWTSPMRKNVFGVNAPLRGKEARELLTRAGTDAGERQVQTVKVKILPKKNETVGFTSKKFRDQVQSLLRDEYLYGDNLATATGATAKEFVANIKDPYTTLFDPVESKDFRDQLSGTVSGIGVHLDNDYMEVMSVVVGSPAEKAGIEAGDVIVKVNNKSIEGLPPEDVINRIRGKSGTPVRIGVKRDGEELAFNIVRAAIEIPDTKFETRSNIAIVTVSQFGDHLIKDAPKLFDDVVASNPDGIVLDLRYNPGGYLQAVPSVLNELLPVQSVYLFVRGRNFRNDYVTDEAPSVPEDMPVVVLTNEGTASSAEIVAGALQDYGRATIVGTKTYGKGTVQTVVPFKNKSSLKFTIAEWLTPDEHPINKIGIIPDVEIEQSDAGDAQLEKALELIRLHPR
jgi:carboxyl-terminal processing protease